ncbi:cell wall hydrolase [Alkalihalobacillus sp. MEB203]|uniref:Cell wall hydrolase n=2 Tax=Alkalihalobacterium chitinilyticum TaxID=2980103 RepID=A0ABT5V932_9BACI|nr:cell wall hydrolase [Alkalihalobacterium chitinilyticum]MDE5411950.1 cell wall hydrolase [Alkalihalobacterium chitinilyticum]
MANKLKYPLVTIICFTIMFGGVLQPTAQAFTDQIIQRGATGDDVVELQARLQYIGFYNQKIDGVYGWSTYWAVRNYQNEFGLNVDGLVGPQMKERLERTTNFNKEFVHKALNEGRSFTHYGTTPLEIQKGPKGSRGQKAQKGAPKEEQQARQQAQPAPRGEQPADPAPAPDARAQEAPPQQQQQPAQPTPEQQPEQPAPEQPAPEQPAEQPAPAEEPTPEPEEPAAPEPEAPEPEEPVPAEETPDAPAGDEPNIEQAMNVPAGFSDNDIQLMAQCVYAEARGEPYVGMVAVAAVILNRVNSEDFPNTISEVIYEPRAFEPVANGEIYNNPSEEARRAVMDAINGQDPTGHALYFFNPATARSPWVWSRPQIKTIGKHVFAK